jgi:endonuclease YncB( thermonuclease family)
LKRSSALLLLSLFLSASPAVADIRGRVVSIHDGDTLTVVVERREVRVRLADIDAPELRQPFGTRSRQSLAEMCFGKVAALDVRGQDRYRRSLARVTCAGTDANAEQVRRGYAWTYARYAPRGSPLHALEQEARAARRGLWADPEPVAPWAWRRNGRVAARDDGRWKNVTR